MAFPSTASTDAGAGMTRGGWSARGGRPTGRVTDASLVFLGTGTSSGVPAIGCDCEVCRSPDRRDRRLRTSGALRFTDPEGVHRTILIDCGPDLRRQALRHDLRRADAILFTHNHVDHVWGLDEVRRFNVLMGAPVWIHAEPVVVGHLERVYQHIFEASRNVQATFVASVAVSRVHPGRAFELHGVRVTPIRLLHGRLPVLGFRFDRVGGGGGGLFPFAWCTDVSSIPPESWGMLGGLRHLCIDGLRHRHHPTHLTVDQAVSVACRVEAARAWLIHVGHELGHAATEAALSEEGVAFVRMAYDGLVLDEDGRDRSECGWPTPEGWGGGGGGGGGGGWSVGL